MNILQYASASEIIQLVVACLGLTLAWIATWRNVVNLSDTPNTDVFEKLVALGNVRRELARTVAQAILVLVGIVSILLPPPPDIVAVDVLQAVLVRFGLIAVTTTLALDSYLERRANTVFLTRLKQKGETAEMADFIATVTTAKVTENAKTAAEKLAITAAGSVALVEKKLDEVHQVAKDAFHEANNVNQKIADLDKRLLDIAEMKEK